MQNNETIQFFLDGVNPWWKNHSYKFDIKDRKQYVETITESDSRLINILIGARRVGKTSILQSVINQLLKKVNPNIIIYIPAELKEIKENGIKSTIESIVKQKKLNLFKDKIYIFIDEIQEIPNWQNDIKLLYDNTKIYFYVTGSSSLLLKKETSKLTGRFILRHVLPLSFTEFKDFYNQKNLSEKNLLEAYFQIGGYPEYVISKNPVYLQQAIESTLYRELLEYYGIRNPSVLGQLLKFLADKVTTPVSASKIAADLKIDDKTAKFYLEYLQSVYLIYPVYRYGRSYKISKSSIPKYYFNDIGVLNLYSIRPRRGHIVENAVFIELLRKNSFKENPDIFYEVINSQEIDFYTQNDLYEVKSALEEPASQLEKYDLTDKKIKIVLDKDYKEIKKLPYFPNLEYIELSKFLT